MIFPVGVNLFGNQHVSFEKEYSDSKSSRGSQFGERCKGKKSMWTGILGQRAFSLGQNM